MSFRKRGARVDDEGDSDEAVSDFESDDDIDMMRNDGIDFSHLKLHPDHEARPMWVRVVAARLSPARPVIPWSRQPAPSPRRFSC